MNEKKKRTLLFFALIVILGAIWYLQSSKSNIGLTSVSGENIALETSQKANIYDSAKEIVSPAGFINTDPFELKDLIGKKVVLVDFWTYSCINCQRTLPHLKAWYEKYHDEGLEIVGIHAPEFEFEKDYDNVLKATEKFGIQYPVVLDNDFATWRAYQNRYWPRKYIIDIDGYVVYDHIGEGGYEDTEEIIQELLKERRERLGEEATISTGTVSPENTSTPNARRVGSPEIYFGYARNTFLGNGTLSEAEQLFSVPDETEKNKVYLEGTWSFAPEYAENSGPARILFRYDAKNVHFVAEADEESLVRVFRDGVFLKEVIVSSSDLYTLVSGEEYGEHTLEMQIMEPNLRVFTFTFG